jgi:hypothetical protein
LLEIFCGVFGTDKVKESKTPRAPKISKTSHQNAIESQSNYILLTTTTTTTTRKAVPP